MLRMPPGNVFHPALTINRTRTFAGLPFQYCADQQTTKPFAESVNLTSSEVNCTRKNPGSFAIPEMHSNLQYLDPGQNSQANQPAVKGRDHDRKINRCSFWLQALAFQLSRHHSRGGAPASSSDVDWNLRRVSRLRERTSLRLAGDESNYFAGAPS